MGPLPLLPGSPMLAYAFPLLSGNAPDRHPANHKGPRRLTPTSLPTLPTSLASSSQAPAQDPVSLGTGKRAGHSRLSRLTTFPRKSTLQLLPRALIAPWRI